MRLNDNNTELPWFRQGWPWFLIALPLAAVVAGGITLWLAVKTSDGLVVDDYYKQGLAIKQTMERSDRAGVLGLEAEVVLGADGVTVKLDALDLATLPDRLRLIMSHPTRVGLDQVVVMEKADGKYRGALTALSSGRWNIQLEDESRAWRLNGAVTIPTETNVRIVASDTKPVD
ncbi:MAG: FixH family protein [Rhodocyclaceae bacterium]|jgi:hypothetical protein|nr:FixH family protein [Rhodocyclaceae bacterium]